MPAFAATRSFVSRSFTSAATAFAGGALGLLLLPAPASAVWTHDLNVPTAVCKATGSQSGPVSVSDGAGGVIVAWADPRGGAGTDIYAQRLSASGVPLWTTDGVVVCGAAQDQSYLSMVADGSGGAILAWSDSRTLVGDIYAQRLTANGTALWTANGVAVCTATNMQNGPILVSDGTGGATLAWQDYRSGIGSADIYAQRLTPMGFPLWTSDGVPVCNQSGDQLPMAICTDGAGGMIVGWIDHRSAGWDIYAQRLNSSGTPLWSTNGSPMCTATGDQTSLSMVADGAGGALLTWQDLRLGNYDVYIQRAFPPNGSALFNSNGLPLGSGTGDQTAPVLVADGNGGAVVAWMDSRSGNYDVYAQRISIAGNVAWAANGVAICSATGDQYAPQIVADGAGGAFLDWQDARTLEFELYAQHLLSSGSVAWAANGVPFCTTFGTQYSGPIVSDGNGGAVIIFLDSHLQSNDDLYAQRVSRFGQIGMPEPTIASVRDIPNDQGGSVKVSWYASWLDQASDPNLTAYDLYRSVPGSVATAATRAGARRLSSFGDVPVAGTRAFLLPNSTELYAWQYLGTVSAVHFLDAYSSIAPTTGDSIGGSNPRTAFLVVGRNASGSMYWLSAPDSGYSVDNIAPATPAPFAGEYAGGSTALHWDPNVEPDFAHYALYRGTSSTFTPGPGNLVASPADTGYVDASGAPYFYKLAAIDVHGNTSGYATLQPSGTVSVLPGGGAGHLALALPSPNPVRTGTTFRFELSRAGPATLALFDQQGRLVRELLGGASSAGVRTVAWDGRDAGGAPAPSGIYFLRLEAEGRTLARRVVVAR